MPQNNQNKHNSQTIRQSEYTIHPSSNIHSIFPSFSSCPVYHPSQILQILRCQSIPTPPPQLPITPSFHYPSCHCPSIHRALTPSIPLSSTLLVSDLQRTPKKTPQSPAPRYQFRFRFPRPLTVRRSLSALVNSSRVLPETWLGIHHFHARLRAWIDLLDTATEL